MRSGKLSARPPDKKLLTFGGGVVLRICRSSNHKLHETIVSLHKQNIVSTSSFDISFSHPKKSICPVFKVLITFNLLDLAGGSIFRPQFADAFDG